MISYVLLLCFQFDSKKTLNPDCIHPQKHEKKRGGVRTFLKVGDLSLPFILFSNKTHSHYVLAKLGMLSDSNEGTVMSNIQENGL